MADKSREVKKKEQKLWLKNIMCILVIITSGYLTTLQHEECSWIIRCI